ncbi:hypothetical protein C8R47DRAFT_998947, partial [Mycena vitilis]
MPANANFLENENRLWEILGLVHILPPCDRKDRLQEKIWRMIDRCSVEKEVHWNQQRLHLDMAMTVRVKDWLGRILSRPGIEDILDEYPETASRCEGGSMSDIWSSPAIKELKGPDGKPFLDHDRPNGEGRFLFSFAVDGFNPFHNKEAKQVVTSTGFFLVLMNFPPFQRYLSDNMCLLGTAP